MPTIPKTVSGVIPLTTAIANNGSQAFNYPSGTSRNDWQSVDPKSVVVTTANQEVWKYPKVTLTIGSQMTIGNASGVDFAAGGSIRVSAKIPAIDIVSLSQSSYDALATKDDNTVYVIPS